MSIMPRFCGRLMLEDGTMGNTNGEKVTAIVQAWAAATDTTPELMAQIAVNVLTDWDKRDLPGWNT